MEDEEDLFLDDLDDLVYDLMDNSEYDGVTVGVARDGKMIFADGYGEWGKKTLHESAVMPISSISKVFTAVAVLQLVEQGELELNAKVFGKDGILQQLKPVEGVPRDRRVHDITVEHLLRHSAGWDQEKGPVYDPMLNKLFLQRGHKAVNITKAMKTNGYLSQVDIIRFMLSTPLDYTPGARSKKSNFGYSVLGRVIETVTDIPYDEYVKKHVLVPCGMIHTRIGPRQSDEYTLNSEASAHGFGSEMNSNLVQGVIDPIVLDSTLGWYSNIFDLSRFMSCLLGTAPRQLLSSQTVELMLAKPKHPAPQYDDAWRGIAFQVKRDGSFWVDSDVHDNDVVLYHKGPWGSPPHSVPFSRMTQGVTVVTLTTNNRFKKLKSAMRRIVDSVNTWPQNMPDVCIEQELADLEIDDKIIRYQIGETHLHSYVNALRMSKYVPTWIHGYNDGASTRFAVVAERRSKEEDVDFELLVEVSKKKLFSHVAQLQAMGYFLSFLQSYASYSHDERNTHIVLLTQATHQLPPEKWGVNEDLDTYFKELGSATKNGFTLEAQSITTTHKGSHATYMMRKLDEETSARYMSFHSLTLKELEDKTRENSAHNFILAYLDTYQIQEEARFSAIYRQRDHPGKWVLQTDITFDNFQSQAEHWEDLGYLPKLVVGYEDEKVLRFATFWVKP